MMIMCYLHGCPGLGISQQLEEAELAWVSQEVGVKQQPQLQLDFGGGFQTSQN